jgi:hypothetical protein
MECVWIQFIVPNLVSKDVLQVNELLSNTVLELCSGKSHTEDNNVLNAPDYLFVSTNLAKMYPNLMESTIIMSYRSYLPGELSKKWNVGSTARISRNSMSSLRGAALVTTVVFLLQILATSPFVLQRLFVRFSQPFFLAGLVYIGSMVFKSPLYISIFSVSIAAVLLYFVYRYLRENHNIIAFMKISPSKSDVDAAVVDSSNNISVSDVVDTTLNIAPSSVNTPLP